MKSVVSAALLSVLFTWSSIPAAAYTEMVVFGDSLSDAGNVLALTTALAATDPRFRPDPPPEAYFNGRATNGPNYADQLATLLGLPGASASLSGGSNYAYAGAKSGFGTNVRFPSPTFPLNPSVDVQRVGSQVEQYLSDRGSFNDDQLVILWTGANDLRDATSAGDVASIVSNIEAHLRRIAATGGNTILVPNQLDSSIIPFVLLPGPPEPATIRPGIILFNTLLASALDAVERDTALRILRFDAFGLSQAIVADPLGFGFSNTTDAALRFNPATGTFSQAPNSEDYLFWDLVHPTTKFHSLFARAVFAEIAEPSVTWLMALGLLVPLLRRKHTAASAKKTPSAAGRPPG